MTDNPASPTSPNVRSPATSSAIGTRIRVGVSHAANATPAIPASATGSFTSAFMKFTVARGTSPMPRVAAELLGEAARVVLREERVAGDDQVGRHPDQRRGRRRAARS